VHFAFLELLAVATEKQIPYGDDNKNSKCKCCDLSTALRFGRDDSGWVYSE